MADNDARKTERKAEQADRKVQQAVGQETEQGFRGVEVDMTNNKAYTVAGVTSDTNVPEAAADPVAARREATNPDL